MPKTPKELKGRELRKAVAEEVMGWTDCEIKRETFDPSDGRPHVSITRVLGTPPHGYGVVETPEYESYANDSKKLLRYLLYKYDCRVEMDYAGDKCLYYITSKDGNRMGPFGSTCPEEDEEAGLCRAALALVRLEKDQKCKD